MVLLLTSPVHADFFDSFAKIRYSVKEFLRDPGLIGKYIQNEYINPVLKRDPYSRYQKQQRFQSFAKEPEYMKSVRKKLDGYFSKLGNYELTERDLEALRSMEISEVCLAVMDERSTYYIKRIYISGNRIKLDSKPSEHMVAITPEAAQELVLMLDDMVNDSFISSEEAKALGTWGKQRYESGDITGKRKDIEAILNFLLGGG